MKSFTVRLVFLLILVMSVFSQVNLSKQFASDQPFDMYGKVSWEEEMGRLDNFAAHLKTNPEAKGYITYFVGKKDSLKKVKARINRAVNYLTQYRKIDKDRLIVTYGGKLDSTSTVLRILKVNS